MSNKRKRIITFVIILFIVIIPALAATLAFYWVGHYYRDDDRIYPNISIAGTDVSWMTRDEAISAIDMTDFEERADNAKVTLVFPDNSVLTIKGEDIQLTHDVSQIVDDAYAIGRGHGFVMDTIAFIQYLNGQNNNFVITNMYDLELLHTRIDDFVEEYNNRLTTAGPLIFSDKIIITKGAGRTCADSLELKDIIYMGLFDSFESNEPVEIIYSLPETKTDALELMSIYDKLHIPVKSAELNLKTLIVEDCVVGVNFDLFDAVALLNDTESGKTATIYIDYIQPEITKEYIESLLFRDLIGKESTRVAGTNDRASNVRLAAETIDGLVLAPGDEFSFNGVVGARSRDRGYKPGGAFVDGELVTVIGGGVCQTASTLYSAIKDTDLKVTARSPHSRSIPYLPRGRDAAVFWNKIDFKFENNTEYPIRIDFRMEERRLYVEVYGTIIDDFPVVPLPAPAG